MQNLWRFLSLLFLASFIVYGAKGEKKKKTALVTGGCGFVGRHFTKRLCDLGMSVTIIDNMISESALPLHIWPPHLRPNASCDLRHVEMDCRDYFASRDSHQDFDLFVHLAAVVGGRAKIEGSPLAVADDLAIDATAFEWAIDSHNKRMPGRMIYFSSSAAYPIKHQTVNSGVLLQENMIDLDNPSKDIAKPDLTYGWAKLTGEYLAKLAHEYYALNVSVYRPMSGYGEDQHEAYPFKSLLQKAMRRDNPIKIWSDAVRDFVHISDIVTCVLSTVDKIIDAYPVNLASGVATSFSDLAKLMAHEVGYTPEIEVEKDMPQGVMYRVGSAVHVKELGCKQQIDLTQGIRQAIAFVRSEQERKVNATKEVQMDTKEKTVEKSASDRATTTYSSYQCIGGSQVVDPKYWKNPRESIRMPLYEPEYRVCHLRNVCWRHGQLTYFEDPQMMQQEALRPFAMESWPELFHLGTWTPSARKLAVERGPVPSDMPYDESEVQYLDGHSNSYNFGHYILDNVMPHYIAAHQFGLEFRGGRQIFESSCKHFGAQHESMADRLVPFNHSMGTFRSACLEKLNGMWKFFFDHPPRYLEPQYSQDVCFSSLVIGQGSTFGLKGVDFSRAQHIRGFRDHVLDRIAVSDVIPPADKVILVGDRSAGHAGGEQISTLCRRVQHALHNISEYHPGYRVRCVVSQDLGFVEEVKAVQEAKVLISVHGTISYMSLFARDHTQQVILYDPNESRLKEHNVLMYSTIVQVAYHPWTDLKEGLAHVLRMTLDRVEIAQEATRTTSHNKIPVDYHTFDHVSAMTLVEGTLIRSPATGAEIFQVRNGQRYSLTFAEFTPLSNRPIIGISNHEMTQIPVMTKDVPVAPLTV